jgi:hypothetical protein
VATVGDISEWIAVPLPRAPDRAPLDTDTDTDTMTPRNARADQSQCAGQRGAPQ